MYNIYNFKKSLKASQMFPFYLQRIRAKCCFWMGLFKSQSKSDQSTALFSILLLYFIPFWRNIDVHLDAHYQAQLSASKMFNKLYASELTNSPHQWISGSYKFVLDVTQTRLRLLYNIPSEWPYNTDNSSLVDEIQNQENIQISFFLDV